MGVQFHTRITNGAIELPEKVRRAISGQTDFVVTLEPEKTYTTESILEFLCEHPLKTNSTTPLSREETNRRN